jgi:hypothetical protein
MPKNKIPKKLTAFFKEILPEAIGLFLVLTTLLSKFRSRISLITQPAERIKKEPIKNNKAKYFQLNWWFWKIIAIAQRQGKNNSQVPMGLLKRIKFKYFFISLCCFDSRDLSLRLK